MIPAIRFDDPPRGSSTKKQKIDASWNSRENHLNRLSYPLVFVKIAIEAMAQSLEIVDLPMKIAW